MRLVAAPGIDLSTVVAASRRSWTDLIDRLAHLFERAANDAPCPQHERAESACADGAIFPRKVGDGGELLPFAIAYPNAPAWHKRLAS